MTWSDKCSVVPRCAFEIGWRTTRIRNDQSVKDLQVAFLHVSIAWMSRKVASNRVGHPYLLA